MYLPFFWYSYKINFRNPLYSIYYSQSVKDHVRIFGLWFWVWSANLCGFGTRLAKRQVLKLPHRETHTVHRKSISLGWCRIFRNTIPITGWEVRAFSSSNVLLPTFSAYILRLKHSPCWTFFSSNILLAPIFSSLESSPCPDSLFSLSPLFVLYLFSPLYFPSVFLFIHLD